MGKSTASNRSAASKKAPPSRVPRFIANFGHRFDSFSPVAYGEKWVKSPLKKLGSKLVAGVATATAPFSKSGSNDEIVAPGQFNRDFAYRTLDGVQFFSTHSDIVSPFGCEHQDVLQYCRGPFRGKTCTVVGVRAGLLWVANHFDLQIEGEVVHFESPQKSGTKARFSAKFKENEMVAVPILRQNLKEINAEYNFLNLTRYYQNDSTKRAELDEDFTNTTRGQTIIQEDELRTQSPLSPCSIKKSVPKPIIEFLRTAPDLFVTLGEQGGSVVGKLLTSAFGRPLSTYYIAPTLCFSDSGEAIPGWAGAWAFQSKAWTVGGSDEITLGTTAGVCPYVTSFSLVDKANEEDAANELSPSDSD